MGADASQIRSWANCDHVALRPGWVSHLLSLLVIDWGGVALLHTHTEWP